ncbi:MAG: DUF4349 domain-containing protein [Armatimonadota bacterium]|nr:DUF4349 domain-containing protein [Armatimonadota bacterium]
MRQNGTESFESPLDEVLENIPQEDPPEDLQQRCVDALEQAAGEQSPSHPRWYAPLRNVVAAAAVLVLIGAIAFPYYDRLREAARSTTTQSGVKHMDVGQVMYVEANEPAPEAYAPEEMPPPQAAPIHAGRSGEAREMILASEYQVAQELSEGREPEAGAGWNTFAGEEPVPKRRVGVRTALREEQADSTAVAGSAPRVATVVEEEEAPVDAVSAGGELGEVVAPSLPGPAARTDEPRTPEVEDPWRDFSGRRQVVSTKEMDVEVRDVEDAYDRARSIVDKHGGFVASDRVQISEGEQDVAHLTIRLPVDQFESAITDLRQLGEVVRLVGESLDVTQQYYQEGAEIRGMADREQWLVDRYERETNARKKRQLKQQIDQLRRELKQEKEILTRLAEQTHWPVLELQLLQSTGPGDFASRMVERSLSTLAWVGATAIIWVPIVVLLTLFWRRIVPGKPQD